MKTISIEQLETILAQHNPDLTVEITPSGEVRTFKPEDLREQGPVNVIPLAKALEQSSY